MSKNGIGWEAHTWNRAVKAARSKNDGKPHVVEMYHSWAPFVGEWWTAFVDGVREVGAALLGIGSCELVRSETIKLRREKKVKHEEGDVE